MAAEFYGFLLNFLLLHPSEFLLSAFGPLHIDMITLYLLQIVLADLDLLIGAVTELLPGYSSLVLVDLSLFLPFDRLLLDQLVLPEIFADLVVLSHQVHSHLAHAI